MDVEEIRLILLENIEKLKSSKGYLNAGKPRYNTLFGRDSLISAWQLLDVDPSIARATLKTLANYQGKKLSLKSEEEPGKILHEYRFDLESQDELANWDFPYYGSVDSTLLFIIVAGEYFLRFKDELLHSQIEDSILSAYEWIEEYGDKEGDGYVEYERKNPHGLFHQGWKDSVEDHLKIKPPVAIVEVQGYLYAAYQHLICLGSQQGGNHVFAEAKMKSEELKRKFNEDFWMEGKSFFALALDGEKKRCEVVTSNPGQLLFTGIVAENFLKPLVSRLFQPDLWTPYGIRNHSAEDPDFDPFSYHKGSVWPHDNWIIYKGLLKLGFNLQANKVKKALLRAYKKLGKIPELYSVEKNEIVDLTRGSPSLSNPLQAWSSGGLLEMLWAN